MMQNRTLILCAISFLFIIGCSSKPKYLAPPKTLAVLPMHNHTNDLDGPEVMRRLIFEKVPSRGYNTIDLMQIDLALRGIGISDGGQLRTVEPLKLGETLNAQLLLYGELLEYGDVNLGIYKNKIVQARFKMIDAATGKKLWEDERKVSNKDFSLSKKNVVAKIADGVVDKAVDKMLNSHLKAEAKKCAKKIMKTMPANR